jgi:hypothetical protein
MSGQLDLFAPIVSRGPPCGDCHHLGTAIDSGLRYCDGEKSWRWPTDEVPACPYRDRPAAQWAPKSTLTRADILRDFLENPKHDPSPKDRRWLMVELRKEERAIQSQRDAA